LLLSPNSDGVGSKLKAGREMNVTRVELLSAPGRTLKPETGFSVRPGSL
jgi:hypothetical protein